MDWDILRHMPKSLGRYFPEQLTLKVTLLGSEPGIWRRVEVHSGLTLHELHMVIQYIFDWDDSHLYQFMVPPGGKLTQKAMREAKRYLLLPSDPIFDLDEPDHPADKALVGHVLNKDQKQIIYEYDFGDSWEHLVKVEKRQAGGDQEHIPQCLAGENASPRDDMGGIGGYYQWLAALRDPNSELHEEAAGWLGKKFDPGHFDLKRANKQLTAIFTPAPKKPRSKRR